MNMSVRRAETILAQAKEHQLSGCCGDRPGAPCYEEIDQATQVLGITLADVRTNPIALFAS